MASSMDFRLSRHAEWEMARRGLPLALVQAVMEHPNGLSTNPGRAAGFTNRGYGSKMGECIYCESSWLKMNSRL